MSSKREKKFGSSRSNSHSSVKSDAFRVPDSPTSLLEKAKRKLFRTTIKAEDHSIFNAVAAIQLGPGGMLVPQEQDNQSTSVPTPAVTKRKDLPDFGSPNQQPPTAFMSTEAKNKDSPSPPPNQKPWLTMFPQNVAAPALSVALPPPGTRFEDIAQLAYCNTLLRKSLSPAMTTETTQESLDSSQRGLIEPYIQDEEEQVRIRWLAQRIVEEFATDSLKSSASITEVVLLGPALDKEYHRKLLNCMIAEFESAKLLDVDLLQGLVQLVQCAGPDYLRPDDLVRILAALRIRLQDTHQQTAKHPYYLALALSRILDVMVEGKVQDLSRVVDHGPLSALLGGLSGSDDLYLKHQATYALQGLLHVPNDETRRQFVLRHAGNIAMGLLGVASVCKLDFSGFSEGASQLYNVTVSALEVGGKAVEGAHSIMESGQGLWEGIKGGVLSGGRKLWYTALREGQEHIRNGRLADFNCLIFEAPCCRDVEFQWGICQFLGEIVIESLWGMATRQHAVDFLVELYRNDSIRTQDEGVDKWILNFLRQVAALPDSVLADRAQTLLRGLEKEGNVAKQGLYRTCMSGPLNPYSINVRMPPPESSTLLSRVLSIPDIEYDLHKLRQQRLGEHRQGVYIPPQAKPSLQSKDDTLFPLMEKVQEFLSSHRQVLLLLGDSGAGKSTFNLKLEHTLWKSYKKYGTIPLHITLPTIDKPEHDLIKKHLLKHNFSEAQIQEMKLYRQFVVICDGYDESQLRTNLHNTNNFNQPGQWKVKVIIGCRSQYLGKDYRARFQPQTGDRYGQTASDLFQEAVIASFSRTQVEQYVEEYVKRPPAHDSYDDRPSWSKEDYMNKLLHIPGLIDLVSNPFLLTLSLHALPTVVDSKKNLSTIKITRVQLYDTFVKRWLEVNQARLEASPLSESDRSALDLLAEESFAYHVTQFQKDLASAIFKEHAGNPIIQYSHLREGKTWKAAFFSPDSQVKLLRDSSTVTRSGVYYRFIHRSLLEYFYSRIIRDPIDNDTDDGFEKRSPTTTLKDSLAQMSIIGEPSIVQFLAERVDSDHMFKTQLLEAIEESKMNEKAGVVAANAISILVRAGHRFHGANLRGIRVPGADLRGGQFDSADFEEANLTNVNLGKAWLRQANLSKASMSGMQFGELPYLVEEDGVARCAYSSDGKLLVVATHFDSISIYDTATWSKVASGPDGYAFAISPNNQELAVARRNNTVELSDILTGKLRLVLNGHTDRTSCVSYSPDGTQIATSSDDSTVRVWSTVSGETVHVLSKHTDEVYGVAFSPSGLQLVSCSKDKTVRTWDAKAGELLATMESHSGYVLFVAYSPDGNQIASCDYDGSVRLWDARTYEICHVLSGHRSFVYCVAYSPDGRQLASCGYDETIRLWDSHTGESSGILYGHTERVKSVVFSPTGDYLASGSADKTARLWKTGGELMDVSLRADVRRFWCVDASPCGSWIVTGSDDGSMRLWESLTGQPGVVMEGHTRSVVRVAYSPCGKRIASASKDNTVRLWDAQARNALRVFEGHTDYVRSVAFSPSGHQIVSGSRDSTVRTWDTQTGQPGFTLEGHTGSVIGVVYSPIGHQIASCSIDKTVRLWCSQTGVQQHVLNLDIPTDQVVYSLDGRYLVSLRPWQIGPQKPSYWDPESGQPVHRLDGVDIEADLCSFSPDGKRIATLHDELLRLWDVELGKELHVRGSLIGRSSEVKWIQGPDYLCLVTITGNALRVWKLVVEKDELNSLVLCWGTRMNKLTVELANLEGAVGLSPANLALMKQRGAIVKKTDE